MSSNLLRGCPYIFQAQVEAPVGLVVTRAGGRVNAMTVSFFSEVAHHPTSMWLSINTETCTHSLLEQTREFSFITLGHRQAAIAVACGTVSGWHEDKSHRLDLYERKGFLFIRGAIASTACRVTQSVQIQDHRLWIANLLHGDVERGRGSARNLLISDLQA